MAASVREHQGHFPISDANALPSGKIYPRLYVPRVFSRPLISKPGFLKSTERGIGTKQVWNLCHKECNQYVRGISTCLRFTVFDVEFPDDSQFFLPNGMPQAKYTKWNRTCWSSTISSAEVYLYCVLISHIAWNIWWSKDSAMDRPI